MTSIELLNDLLIQGSKHLDLSIGIISNINGQNYKVITSAINGLITTPDDNYSIKVGSEFELAETYCSDVIRESAIKYYHDVENISSMKKHPCYTAHQLRAYIGSPLHLNGEVFGTINYSSLEPREHDFSFDEINFIETQARFASNALNIMHI